MFVWLTGILAGLDLGIKWGIERQEASSFPKPLGGENSRIWLQKSHNDGFPFGFLKEHGELVRAVPLAVTSALFGVLWAIRKEKGKTAQKFGLSILLGGAVSNLFDRFFRSYVVDYFSIQAGALKKVVFNLGDMMVFLGTAILAFGSLSGDKEQEETVDTP